MLYLIQPHQAPHIYSFGKFLYFVNFIMIIFSFTLSTYSSLSTVTHYSFTPVSVIYVLCFRFPFDITSCTYSWRLDIGRGFLNHSPSLRNVFCSTEFHNNLSTFSSFWHVLVALESLHSCLRLWLLRPLLSPLLKPTYYSCFFCNYSSYSARSATSHLFSSTHSFSSLLLSLGGTRSHYSEWINWRWLASMWMAWIAHQRGAVFLIISVRLVQICFSYRKRMPLTLRPSCGPRNGETL